MSKATLFHSGIQGRYVLALCVSNDKLTGQLRTLDVHRHCNECKRKPGSLTVTLLCWAFLPFTIQLIMRVESVGLAVKGMLLSRPIACIASKQISLFSLKSSCLTFQSGKTGLAVDTLGVLATTS